MPLVLNNKSPWVAFQFGYQGACRTANAAIDQLTEQLYAARREIAELRHELAQERHATAAREVVDAFERLQRSPETFCIKDRRNVKAVAEAMAERERKGRLTP